MTTPTLELECRKVELELALISGPIWTTGHAHIDFRTVPIAVHTEFELEQRYPRPRRTYGPPWRLSAYHRVDEDLGDEWEMITG